MPEPQININVNITVDNLNKFKKALKLLAKKQLLAGFPEAKAKRKEGPINNAMLAKIQNDGSPINNIPARPFMEPGIMDVAEPINKQLLLAGEAILDNNEAKAIARLNAAGLIAQNGIRNKINSNLPPPLKPSTLKARRRRGIKSTRSLVVSGQLRNAATYVLKDKN